MGAGVPVGHIYIKHVWIICINARRCDGMKHRLQQAEITPLMEGVIGNIVHE